MATQTSVRDYSALLAKSKLLSAEEVEAYCKRWKDEARGTDEQVESFCKFLISNKAVTEWQAAMVRRGRADGFFIAEYKILDRIGKGQMGGVYKAAHKLGQIVALKILPGSKAKDQHILGRFQREARLLTQLDHPNVVRAFQVGESNGINYIAMEFLEGETLDEILTRRKRLPWAETIRLIQQALEGLQHLYEKRMIHRDIKPANMMLVPAPGKQDATWDSTIRILDIGLGRELFDEDTPEGQIETQLTVEGSVLGTPDYLAPEQAKDARSADIRADIYSIGCVLFHCLCGRPPFPEANIMSQMLKHATEKPPPIASIVSDVPPALQSIMDSMLAKFPDDRYATPAAVSEALKPFLGSSGVESAAAPMVPAFKEWLEAESHVEAPKKAPPASNLPTKPSPATPTTGPVKPGTVPSPALAIASAPAKEPAAKKNSGSKVVPITPARPIPVAPARPPGMPRAAPIEDVNVELIPEFTDNSVPLDQQMKPRPLWEFDRRDWIMLAAGAAGVLAAVGVGYGLARLARKKPEETPADE
jgi:serine/threonine protein kinase